MTLAFSLYAKKETELYVDYIIYKWTHGLTIIRPQTGTESYVDFIILKTKFTDTENSFRIQLEKWTNINLH